MQENAHSSNSPTTISDIAKVAGVSPSTVSRSLKDSPSISKATKDRIKKIAKSMGYRKNALAASLRNRHSNTIGLIVPRISMYFIFTSVTEIQNILSTAGYNTIICQSNESVEEEKQLINTLYDARVDGLLVSATMHTTDFSPFDLFKKNDIPLVFFDRVPKDFKADIIRGDDFQGGYTAARYLIEKGFRDIAFINGLLTCNLYQDRGAGFMKALSDGGIKISKKRIFNQLLTTENAITACQKLFDRKPYPDAVFCANDTTAIEVHRHAKKLGLRIPEDIKILGYTNDPRAEIISPSLSSIEQFPSKIGRLAAQRLLYLLKSKESLPTEETVVPVKLVKRSSV